MIPGLGMFVTSINNWYKSLHIILKSQAETVHIAPALCICPG